MRTTVAVLAVLLLAVPARATTWNVFADGSGDAPTIPAAMDSAVAGDSVLVWAGTYRGTIPLETEIALIGPDGPDFTTLDADGADYLLEGGSAPITGVVVEGFTLTGIMIEDEPGPFPSSGYCVLSAVGNIEVNGCIVRDNASLGSGPLLVVGDLTVRGTRFTNNYSGWCLPGPSAIQFLGQGTGSLAIEGCLFEDGDGLGVSVEGGHLEFRNNVVRRNRVGIVLDGSTLSAVIEHNLFTEQTQESIQICDGALGVVIRGNTFARNADRGLGPYVAAGTVIEENVFTGHLVGLHLCSTCTGITVRCNDSWGNRGLNWMGFPDPTGIDGNISEPPKYCDAVGGDFTVAENSPLLPANNSCGVPIGAFGAGCGPLSITSASWGSIKAGYRE